jgi:carbon starvation protein
MSCPLLADLFWDTVGGQSVLRAMPLLLGVLCILAIAYRYYSAFLAARVAALDDSRPTPAHVYNDGQNYHPTNRWVLFGHHFAAISGAGPLIGPVLAIQYGYMPGLLWLVIGVCLAGAVQDMLVLAASVRRGGKSLVQIALTELGRPAAVILSLAILLIVVVALAGLGFVVVKALGGDEIKLADGMQITLPDDSGIVDATKERGGTWLYDFPAGCTLCFTAGARPIKRPEPFRVRMPADNGHGAAGPLKSGPGQTLKLPQGSEQVVPGSSWGTFTIACTIPIALLMGWYTHRFRKGKIGEASAFGAVAVLAAVIAGNWIPGSPLEAVFSLTKGQSIWALTIYGFIAAVLPVWLLLVPRDYLSSFLKIGTIGLLVVAVALANPPLHAPAINHVFLDEGPTFKGSIFPFVFICVMCGAISGFHALVASGTTPKMVNRESDVRMIGYGAMLMEGLVGIVALVAAASLPVNLYYDINTALPEAPRYQQRLEQLYQDLGIAEGAGDPLHQANVDAPQHLPVARQDLAGVEKMVGNEALRGRVGGAVTLAVGMAFILNESLWWTNLPIADVMKYWYHFAIMFEALFILTTIDAGTRIARFLLQETAGKLYAPFERTNWLPGALAATLVVTAAWGLLVSTGSIDTIWPMFGIANQLLSVAALALVTTLLVNTGRARFAPITLVPMLFVTTTTMTAGVQMVGRFQEMINRGQELADNGLVLKGVLNLALTLFVMLSVGLVLLLAGSRWAGVLSGMIRGKPEGATEGA